MNELERQIIDLARQVRQAQIAYFATRTSDRLNTSKRLERQLDKLLDAYGSGRPQATQTGFFVEEGGHRGL